jgi:hypothetical protein
MGYINGTTPLTEASVKGVKIENGTVSIPFVLFIFWNYKTKA